MNIDWQALRDKQIAVVCRSAEECEAFLREAAKQNIPMRATWLKGVHDAAKSCWLRTEDDYGDWSGVAYGFSEYEDLGFCWPSWWADRGHQLVDFADARAFAIPTIDDLI